MTRIGPIAVVLVLALAGCLSSRTLPAPASVQVPGSSVTPTTGPAVPILNTSQPVPPTFLAYQYAAKVACAVSLDGTGETPPYYSSCDPNRPTGRPWSTDIDLRHLNFTIDPHRNFAQLILRWTPNHGTGFQFSFCWEIDVGSARSKECREFNQTAYDKQIWGVGFNFLTPTDSTWDTGGPYGAWIEFPLAAYECSPQASVDCRTKVTIAQDWEFRLEVLVTPGVSIR